MAEETKKNIWDMVIIGAGTAGLTAALYGIRSGNRVLVIEENVHGGQIITTPEIENFPGLPKVSGVDYVQALYNQVDALGMELVYEKVTIVDLKANLKVVETAKNVYYGKTVIIATGAKHRLLGCPGEQKFTGRGVSYCATCDGAFYKNKEVAVVGGGNTALEDALFLANNCSKVYLIHRRDTFRGEDMLVSSVLERENIEILYDTVVDEIVGEKKVAALQIRNNKTEETNHLPVSGVFIAVGVVPDNMVFANAITLDNSGYVVAGEDCKTNLSGVFVAGDTRTKPLRQLVTAAADGAVAATEAAKYINQKIKGGE